MTGATIRQPNALTEPTLGARVREAIGDTLAIAGRDLVRTAIWDKGVSQIQRDMVKWEYVYTINQGPWFCRARILAGLVLEPAWPRVLSGMMSKASPKRRLNSSIRGNRMCTPLGR